RQSIESLTNQHFLLRGRRNNLSVRSETGNDAMEVDMSTLAFATSGPLHQTRFVIVNDRLPRTDEHCALCGGRIEKGYVRDSRTRLIYCDTQCFAGGARMALPIVKSCGRKVS